MPNLTDLTLVFSFSGAHIRPSMSTSLAEVTLPYLQLLKTNLPHSVLMPFLQNPLNTKNLLFLVLHTAGRDAPAYELPSVLTLECSIDCFQAARFPNVERLTLHNNSQSIFTSLYLQQALPLRHLANLTLQFYSNDYDILDKVVTFAPRVRKLRIMELVAPTVSKSTPFVSCAKYIYTSPPKRHGRIPGRRAWKAVSHMAAMLKKLPLLEEFMLDSAYGLAEGKGCVLTRKQEEQLVHGWLTGHSKMRSKARSFVKYHPILYRISLFYGRHDPSTQTLSVWTCGLPKWKREIHQSGRMVDVVL